MSTSPNNPPAPSQIEGTSDDQKLFVLRKNHLTLEQLEQAGIQNGLMTLAPQRFLEYITANTAKNRLIDYVDYLRQRQSETRTKIINLEQRHQQRIESRHQITHWEKKEERLQKELEDKKAQYSLKKQEAKEIKPEYGLIATALFMLAGLIFMATDYSITQNIAVNALNMQNDANGYLPIGEATIFALGLAFLAIVLKPLVDRFFEKPYLNGQHRNRIFWALVTVSLLALFNLGVMGAYRKDAFVAEQKIKFLKEELSVIKSQLTIDNQNIELNTSKKELERLIEQQEEKLDSGLVTALFILSSILFAAAGAICFSIGFPSARRHWDKQFTNFSAWQLKKQVDSAYNTANEDAANQITRYRIALDTAENMLPPLDSLDQLNKELDDLRDEEQQAIEEIYQHVITAQRAWYLNNHAFGQQFYPSNDLALKFTLRITGNSETATTGTFVRRGPAAKDGHFFNNKYLYQRIRESLNNQFVHQGKSNQNGSSIHTSDDPSTLNGREPH